jgi:hypothetical protein
VMCKRRSFCADSPSNLSWPFPSWCENHGINDLIGTVSISFSSPMSATPMIRHSRSIEILGWAWSQREGKSMWFSPKSRLLLDGFHYCLPSPASTSLPLWEVSERALSIWTKVFVSFVSCSLYYLHSLWFRLLFRFATRNFPSRWFLDAQMSWSLCFPRYLKCCELFDEGFNLSVVGVIEWRKIHYSA